MQDPSHKDTKENIVRLSNEAMKETIPDGEHIWSQVKGVSRGEKEWLQIIDKGNSTGGPKGREYTRAQDNPPAPLARDSHQLGES